LPLPCAFWREAIAEVGSIVGQESGAYQGGSGYIAPLPAGSMAERCVL
jgi:hypothetical protein